MVGEVDDVQRCAVAQFCANRPQQFHVGESIARSLQEEHWNRNFCEVVRAFCSWVVRRVKWKAEEDQATNAVQKILCCSLGCHSAAHGFASCQQGQIGGGGPCRLRGGCDCCGEDGGRIGNASALFHVRELVAKGCDADGAQLLREIFHERMIHAGAGSVRECQKPARIVWADQEGGDVASVSGVELQLFGCCHFDAILAELDGSWLARPFRST